jgi:hypothetical protein
VISWEDREKGEEYDEDDRFHPGWPGYYGSN